MIRKLLTIALLLGAAVTLALAGNQEMRTYELYSGATRTLAASQTDSSAYTSYRIPIRGASKVYVWIRSANTASWATTDSIYTDSISTFTALFGDSVSFYARDSSGTLVTFRNFPANTPGYGNKAFPVLADSVSLTTSNTSDSLKWVGITHFVTNFPLKNGTIAHVWPAARLTINTAGAYTAISVPDPIGVIQPSFMWIKLLATRRSTFSAVGVAAGNRTAGINGLRATATVVYPNR